MKSDSGISIRENQVKNWLKNIKFQGEYLLVSTKSNSVYSKKLARLKDGQRLIVDLYTPIFLEKELTLSKWKPQDWVTRWKNKEMVKKFLVRGNHFLVANHRQRQYWFKTAHNLGVDLALDDITVLPTGSGIRLPITDYRLPITDCKVILWFGGIYPWMDPVPLIEAFSSLAIKFPKWKLRILGGFHPETGYIEKYQNVVDLAKRLIPEGQLEVVPWQSADRLDRYLHDVAVAVHLVKSTDEDYYAHRVRLLTLLETGIPVITGGRDVVSDLIDEVKTGVKIKGTVENLTRKLDKVMSDPKMLVAWRPRTYKAWKLLEKREHILAKCPIISGDKIKSHGRV